ncbi:hypothetical protein [Actinomadura rayongensis]|uniref:Uncharacterized protein n=1 Tax=Actinomadura rayongensis TaxID=1429076 RepID=A0A6I4W3H4_9ACTN|nr:hypothetical protein [Actinomadura rayongensis]MXQ63958.1 hypothetical protein [Actinomadura rayongensis]
MNVPEHKNPPSTVAIIGAHLLVIAIFAYGTTVGLAGLAATTSGASCQNGAGHRSCSMDGFYPIAGVYVLAAAVALAFAFRHADVRPKTRSEIDRVVPLVAYATVFATSYADHRSMLGAGEFSFFIGIIPPIALVALLLDLAWWLRISSAHHLLWNDHHSRRASIVQSNSAALPPERHEFDRADNKWHPGRSDLLITALNVIFAIGGICAGVWTHVALMAANM